MARILIIDDEKSIRRTLREILEYENFKVEEAADGLEGLTLVQKEKFDIILANINLNVILDNLKSIVLSSISNTYVLLSGFLLQDETELKSSITAAGLQYISTLNRADWILVLAKKP